MRHRISNDISAAIALATFLALMIGAVVQAAIDPNRLCVDHAYLFNAGVQEYVQDYDEHLPPASIWNDRQKMHAVVTPYVPDSLDFRCPTTGALYALNPVIAGKTLASFEYLNTIVLFRDAQPHTDGKFTVAYLDGSIEHGGIDPQSPDTACRTRLQAAAFALRSYMADYDDTLPPAKDDAQFRLLLQPYIRNQKNFVCPSTDRNYTIAPSIRGRKLRELGDPSKVAAFQDETHHATGIYAVAYLDGHVEQFNGNGDILYASPAKTIVASTTSRK